MRRTQKRSSNKKSKSSRATKGARAREQSLVRHIMTLDVEVLKPTDSAADAARKMRDLDVGVIPVCEDGRLVGVVTDRDITIRVTAEGKDPNMVQLSDCCSQDPVTATLTWSVDRAADTMAKHQIRRLPVVDQGMLVGMVSLGDLAVKAQKPEAATKALKEISEPSTPSTRSQKAIA